MAPPPTVTALSDLSARHLEFIIHHVFLPPQLPSATEDAETLPDLEAALLEALQKSLKAFAQYCPDIKGTLDLTSDGLDRMFTTMTTAGVLSESMVAEELQKVCANHAGVLPLYIRAQNAGALVASTNEGLVCEVFEISPCNAAVITTKGRLLRTFPGPAIVVGSKVAQDPDFQTMLSHTLSKMSSQPVRGMQPKSQKAGTSHDEDRDTTSPAAVTELVLSLLRASGETTELKNVSKSIRDEVFWAKGVEIPWRRSPIWMFVRVFLHVTFARKRTNGENYYKAFLMFFMARVLETARRTLQHGEMLYCMTSKVMRRLHKLPPGVPAALRNVVCNTLSNAGQAISDTWYSIQDPLSHRLNLAVLSSLNFAADCQVAIPDLDEYITSSAVALTSSRVAEPKLTTGAIQLTKGELAPTLSFSPKDPYAIANLEEFETWVASGLAEIDLSADEFASKISKCLVNYLQVAGKAYSGNAEALSIMVLTAVELWVACDKRSIEQCSLLRKYDPEIPSNLLESLVLSSKSQLVRLRVVEDYLASRKDKACFSSKYLFHGSDHRGHGNDFAVQYYNLYKEERGLERFRNALLQRAQQERQAKIQELWDRQSQYLRWKRSWEQSSCDMKTVLVLNQRGILRADRVDQVHDDEACQKCALADKMNKLNIQVHEWPLPSDTDKAKAIIFELHVPVWFAHWRDSTACLILDVFKARHSKTLPVTPEWSIYDDFHLKDHVSGEKHRIVLWSESKAQKKTHFKRKWLNKEPPVDEVCVENGLKYRYCDAYSRCFLTGFVTTPDLPRDCTYRLRSEAKALESFISRPPSSADGPTPNSVISSQTVFPAHMNVNEYAELASLPLGHRIQWMNILVQLRSPGVDWKKEETVMFVLQCIGQVGPPGTTAIRPGHETASREDFAKQVLAALEDCLEKIRENWESANALIVFSTLAWRLKMLNTTSKHIRDACIAFISNVIAVAFAWVQRLRKRSQEAATSKDRTNSRTKTIELALICATCFSGDQEALITLSSNESLASALFQCCMIISERVLHKATDPGSIWSLLYLRFKRLLRQRYRILRHDSTGLDTAVAGVWSIHQAEFQGWTSVQGEKSHWLVAQLKPAHGDTMAVHYNLLTGEFLVDGDRIKRLPRSYQDHPLHKTLFGTSEVEVLASKVPGMRFSTTTTWEGFQVHLGWKDGDILVKAWRNDQLYQLVPSRVLQGIYPSSFQAEYIHWFNQSTHTVEFRPAGDPWKTSPTMWTLNAVSHHAWELSRGDTRVLGLRNRSTKEISTALSPLAEPTTVHMTLDSNNRLEIDFPEIKTGFFLYAQSPKLYSREFPGMIVAEDQSLGTLIGFSNKLILKHENGTRRVLVLEGPVSYKRWLKHVEVTIDRARARRVHDLEIDERLGLLKDRGSLQCKLFLALLHALTSYCLADPATRKTGTEQALTILRSAATRSFEHLNEQNIELLLAISRITPARSYYPSKDLKPMQSVDWDPELSFLSQHGGLYKAVEAILEQAEQSNVFFADSDKVPTLGHAEPELLERDLIRSSTFRVDGFGAEYFNPRHDREYRGRDRDQDSDRAINAFIVSSIVFGKKKKLHWNAPAGGTLWQSLSMTDGPLKGFDLQTMKFDSGLLEGSGEKLIRYVPMMHAALKNADEHKINKYDLAIWLSSMAFGVEPRLEVIQAVALMFTVPSLRDLEIPRVESCSPADGCTINSTIKEKLIEDVVQNAVVDFDHSPDATTSAKPGQSARAAHISRDHKYRLRIKNAAKAVVEPMWKSWDKVDANTRPRVGREHLPYLNLQEAVHIIANQFQVLRDNRALHSYLCQVEMSLSALGREEQAPPFLKQAPKVSWHEYECGYFSVDDLFSKKAPKLPSALPVLPTAEKLVANVSTQEAAHQRSLGKLMDRFQRMPTTYEQDYLKDLRESAGSLGIHRAGQQSAQEVPDRHVLETFRNRANEHLEHVQSKLNEAMTAACVSRLLDCQEVDTATIQGHKFTVQHLPRVSPVFLLGQLNRQRWTRLSPAWQTCIVQYALATTTLQRAERLLVAHSTPGRPGLLRELANPGHTNWSPFEYPETLLLEAEANILVRDVQEQIASEMRSPPRFTQNAVLQLSMGEGKSSVIVPMVAAALANTSQLVRVVVAKPQSKQMAQMLVSKLGGLLNRRLFFMPISRAVKLTKSKIKALERLCKECMAEGGVMLLQPEHIMSFKLMEPELLINNNAGIGQDVLRLHDWLDMNSRDIIDECDDILDVHNELIYTIGAQRPIEMTPLRWTCIQQVLDLVKLHASNMASSSGLEFQDRGTGCFPRIRFLNHETGDEIMRRVARQVCDEGLRGFPAPHQTSAARESLYTYITQYDLSKEQIKAVENGPLWSNQFRTILLLLRGLFATDILAFVFGRKRWRVNYGTTNREPPTRLAVPYRAKDCPTMRSEFSHPEVVILLTSLSCYYGGLNDDQLFDTMVHLKKVDAQGEYRSWTAATSLPKEFCHLDGVNLSEKAACTSAVFPQLRKVKGAIDFFLSHVVFPKEMREFPNKMSASGWDLGKVKRLPTTGFSGTNDSKDLLPLDVTHLDLKEQAHTNALVLGNLLHEENSVALMSPADESSASTDAERLLNMVVSLPDSPDVILDVGAQILELDNLAVASAWLAKRRNKMAAIFCNENDELTVVDRRGNWEPFQTSTFVARTDECLVYLDEAHTRGIDIKLPSYYRAACTLGANLTKDRICQAAMRMRELGQGQSVVFCVSNEISSKIRACTNKHPATAIEVIDVLHWAIAESFAWLRRSIALWTTQGHRFVLQESLWRDVCIGGKDSTALTPEQAQKFLEPEARSIAFRYRPGRAFEDQLKKLEDQVAQFAEPTQSRLRSVIDHCKRFGRAEQGARRLQEEQERELSAEVEEEAVVERAVPAAPATHQLSKDLRKLVQTGRILPGGSAAYEPAFASLRDTTAARDFNPAFLDTKCGSRLLVTADFARTVEKQPRSPHTSDAFQRHVQWILTIRKSPRDLLVDVAILLSPFEAYMLLDDVRHSEYAALHLYKPRCSEAHPALDKLDLYTISKATTKPLLPRQLSAALNVFAGQIYFDSYEEYQETCRFLGLASERARPEWKVTGNGFILSDGTASGEKTQRQNPVDFLKVLLMKVRRNVEFDKSHMARVLEGDLLMPTEFGSR